MAITWTRLALSKVFYQLTGAIYNTAFHRPGRNHGGSKAIGRRALFTDAAGRAMKLLRQAIAGRAKPRAHFAGNPFSLSVPHRRPAANEILMLSGHARSASRMQIHCGESVALSQHGRALFPFISLLKKAAAPHRHRVPRISGISALNRTVSSARPSPAFSRASSFQA